MSRTDTKTALLDCAQDLIQRVGVNAMSYKHLSDEVGIRKASIHYHFPRKEDLVLALLNRCTDTYSCMYTAIVDGDLSGRTPSRIDEKRGVDQVIGPQPIQRETGDICCG